MTGKNREWKVNLENKPKYKKSIQTWMEKENICDF
jgi:hypothetical protein